MGLTVTSPQDTNTKQEHTETTCVFSKIAAIPVLNTVRAQLQQHPHCIHLHTCCVLHCMDNRSKGPKEVHFALFSSYRAGCTRPL